MTEAEWLATGGPVGMLELHRAKASRRKLRLLDCSCGRHLAPWFPNPLLEKALERAESLADGQMGESTRMRWLRRIEDLNQKMCLQGNCDPKAYTACAAVSLACGPSTDQYAGRAWIELKYPEPLKEWLLPRSAYFPQRWLKQARRVAVATIRDIFGNPFRPVTFDPAWRTTTAVQLAQGMYDSRDFRAMSILADALQDAGCDNDDILTHCRGPGPHVRGCWVVDLILGKE